jgi:hypothetical protein
VYEYVTHAFCSFNVYAFVGYLEALANSGISDEPAEEYTVPSFTKETDAPTQISTTSKRMDYTLRTDLATDRYKIPEKQQTHLFQNCATPAETLAELSPYEFHFRAHKQKKPKSTDKDGVTCAYVLKQNETSLARAHPQFETHFMSVRDVSNPKRPHLIPNMLGYILPNVRSDPEKYYLIMMALFSPYHSRDNILSNPYGDDYKSYEASFFGFMNHLEENNPIRHAWLSKLMANMNSIREGSQQQQLERAKLEELKQAQNLAPPDVEGPYGNDADEVQDGATYATEDELADVMRTIPHRYKHLVPKSVKVLVDLVSDEANIHPSMIKVFAHFFSFCCSLSPLDSRCTDCFVNICLKLQAPEDRPNPRAYPTGDSNYDEAMKVTAKVITASHLTMNIIGAALFCVGHHNQGVYQIISFFRSSRTRLFYRGKCCTLTMRARRWCQGLPSEERELSQST